MPPASGGAGGAGGPASAGAAPPPRRRWRSVLLIVSLALNLFLVGILAGGRLADWRDHGSPGAAALGPGAVSQLLRELPASTRIEARRMFMDRRPEIRRHMRELRNARVEALRILRAEPFDQAAFAAAMATVRDRTLALQAAVQEVLIELSGRVDAETRARLADAAVDMHRHHRWRQQEQQ
ncbi:MAG: periplasmic heavy metal sensor [Alphaproteobacteria bacterium]|jgi:uncharacterized membrane protein|nr:periplasmic heavy metal sensor [Alphaproteobacteria bacterium]